MPAVNHTITQIWFSEIPTESAALWLSATALRARPIRVLEKNTASAAIISEAITAAAMSSCWNARTAQDHQLDRALRQVELARDHLLRTAAENEFAEADQEIGEPERRHEEDDVGLVDQRAQHHPLDDERQHEHDADGDRQRQERRHALLVRPTSVSAAKTTMMPCAKLNTPDALKMSTKPSAMSA